MGLFSGIIGGSIGTVGKIVGGIAAAKTMSNAYKKAINNINQLRSDNQNWYDQRYNEDATQRADAQALLKQTEETIRNRNRQAAGTQAVAGGTEESVAATKAANADALADATSKIAVNADQRKDAIEQTYQTNERNYVNQLNDLTLNKATNTANAITAASSELGKWSADASK